MFAELPRRRPWLASWCAVVLVVVTSWAIPGHADPRVDKIARQLSDGSSFQVRVQAALALGTFGSEAAVSPLCGALDDEAASVRAAAAAALGRLKRNSGRACLRRRLAKEKNASVKTQMQRAMARIERAAELRAAAEAHRAPTRKSRFYVAVAPTKCKARRRKDDVELLVQATIRRLLMKERGVGLAPAGESKSRFDKVAQRNRVTGYLLRPTVESISYDGSHVSVSVRLTLFTYPGMALKAEYSPTLSMSGTRGRDREAENKLLRMAAEKATQKFLQTTK